MGTMDNANVENNEVQLMFEKLMFKIIDVFNRIIGRRVSDDIVVPLGSYTYRFYGMPKWRDKDKIFLGKKGGRYDDNRKN